jgi:hypothetical protein
MIGRLTNEEQLVQREMTEETKVTLKAFHAQCLGTLPIEASLHTKAHMLIPNDSLVIVMKSKLSISFAWPPCCLLNSTK